MSNYTKKYISDTCKKETIKNDCREVYFFEGEYLDKILKENNIKSDKIKKWVYLPKKVECMSKARVANFSAIHANSNNLFS